MSRVFSTDSEFQAFMKQLGIKYEGIKFVAYITYTDEDSVLATFYKKSQIAIERDINITVENRLYTRLTMLIQAYPQLTLGEIIMTRILDSSVASVNDIILEVFNYTSRGIIRTAQGNLSISEVLRVYNIPDHHLRKLHDFTGITMKELAYLYTIKRSEIDSFFYAYVEPKNGNQVLQPSNPYGVRQATSNPSNVAHNQQQVQNYTQQTAPRQTVTQQNTPPVVKPLPIRPNEVKPKPAGSTISYNGGTYTSPEALCQALQIDQTLLALDTSKGMSITAAIDKQYKNKGTRTSSNAMLINNLSYNSQREVCLVFGIEEAQVSFYKSKEGCDSYNAVMKFIEEKYGYGYFR